MFASYELKKVTMYQNLKLSASQFHPCFFSNYSEDDDEAEDSISFNDKVYMDCLNIIFHYYGFEEVT